jgi:hypothetical protein
MSNYRWLQYSTFFFYPVLTGLLPLITPSVFRNVRCIVRLRLSSFRRQVTAMVLIRVVIFVLLVTPYVIYRIYIINFPCSPSKPMEYAIGRLIQMIDSRFMISSLRFRCQVKYVLIKRYRWCFRIHQISPENAESYRTRRNITKGNAEVKCCHLLIMKFYLFILMIKFFFYLYKKI